MGCPRSRQARPTDSLNWLPLAPAIAMVFGSGKSVYFTASSDRGLTFSKPVEIASIPLLALGRHRGPRVAFSGQALLVSAIGGSTLATGPHAHGLSTDGDLLLWRSADNGRTWSKSTIVNDVPGSAREGLHAMAADDQGHAALVWLDLRGKGTRLYGSFSNDSGATWSPNFLVYESPDGTICQCCHPSLAATGSGEFAVMFRNALAGCRDMYVLRMSAGKVIDKPAKAGQGTWPINACPMDGGGLANSSKGLAAAWRREQELFVVLPGDAEQRVGEGKDIALAAAGDQVYAVWSQAEGIRYWTNGRAGTLSESGAFASISTLPDGSALAAWENNGAISLARLP